ncbi:MAG: hypothetical protein V1773_07135 [bacterium]
MKSIFSSKHFWAAFILTITICIGISLSFLNCPTIGKLIDDSWSIDLLVGQITIYIVFFTFVQFSFSSIDIPKNMIRKYIIEAKYTILYIGYNLSAILILMYNSICSFNSNGDNYSINGMISLLIVFGSVLSSTAYMFWLIRKSTFQEIGKMIVDSIDFDKTIEIQQNIQSSVNSFRSVEKNLASIFQYKNTSNTKSQFFTRIFSSKHGLIERIKIIELAEYIKNVLPEDIKIINVEFRVKPGCIVNEDDKLVVIMYNNKSQKEPGFEELIGDQIKKVIEKFIVFNEEYSEYNTHISSLMTMIYMPYVRSTVFDTNMIIDEFRSKIFIWLRKNSTKANSTEKEVINAGEVLLSNMLLQINNYLRKSDLNDNIIEVTYRILYLLCHIAIDTRFLKGSIKIMQVLNYFHSKILYQYPNFQERLENSVLRIKELTVIYGLLAIKDKFKINSSDVYYITEMISMSMDEATIAIFNLLKNYHKMNLYESLQILYNNIQELINYIDFYKPNTKSDKEYKMYLENLSIPLQNRILCLAIIIYRKIEEYKIEPDRFIKFVVPMIRNCVNIRKYNSKYYFIIGDIISGKIDITNGIHPSLKEAIEIEHIHESGMYEIEEYNYDVVWVLILLYLKINEKIKDNREEYKKLLEVLKKHNTKNVQNQNINYFMSLLEKMEKEFLCSIMNIKIEELNNFLEDIRKDLGME